MPTGEHMATWTQADVDALKTAAASGILTVRYDGPPARMITYQSLRDMQRQIVLMEQELARSSGTTSTYTFAATRKGL